DSPISKRFALNRRGDAQRLPQCLCATNCDKLSDPNLYTGQEKRTPGYLRSPSTLRSGYPLELHRLCGEVDSEPIPPQQVRPEEDLLSWHKGGLCEEGLPIKGEIDKIEIFLHVLPAPEGDLDTANEPGVDGLAQVDGQFQLPIEARINSRGPGLPRHREQELGHTVVRHRPGQHRWHPFRRQGSLPIG